MLNKNKVLKIKLNLNNYKVLVYIILHFHYPKILNYTKLHLNNS